MASLSMKSAGLVTVLSCPSLALGQTFLVHTEPLGVDAPFHSIFYEGDSPPYETLPLSDIHLTRSIARIIPKVRGTFGMADLRCKALTGDGHLRGCRVDVAPQGVGYEAAARMLAGTIRVDPSYLQSGRQRIRFIDIQLKMWNSDRPVVAGPCWPPSCSAVPLPPPPAPTNPSGG